MWEASPDADNRGQETSPTTEIRKNPLITDEYQTADHWPL